MSTTDFPKSDRIAIGNAFDSIGTLAIKGECSCEKNVVTKEELREIMQKIMDKTHMIQQLLQ